MGIHYKIILKCFLDNFSQRDLDALRAGIEHAIKTTIVEIMIAQT